MPRKIVARKSAIHGNGVFALVPIAKGERIVEYKGQRRTHAEVDAGDTGAADSGHTFLFTLDEPHTARMKKIWACHCGAKNCTGTMLKPKR
jgi:SET domain-containing protein